MKAALVLLGVLGPVTTALVVPRTPISFASRSRVLSPLAAAEEGATEVTLDPVEESPPVAAVAEEPAPVVEPEPVPEPVAAVAVPKAKSAAIPFLPEPPANSYVRMHPVPVVSVDTAFTSTSR